MHRLVYFIYMYSFIFSFDTPCEINGAFPYLAGPLWNYELWLNVSLLCEIMSYDSMCHYSVKLWVMTQCVITLWNYELWLNVSLLCEIMSYDSMCHYSVKLWVMTQCVITLWNYELWLNVSLLCEIMSYDSMCHYSILDMDAFSTRKYSRLSLSRTPRDSMKHFKISILRHIRFAEMRKTINRTTTFNIMTM